MNHAVFGPLGRRIVELVASPNGQYLAFQHVPQNYSTADYRYGFFSQSGDTFVEAGELPPPAPMELPYQGTMQRQDFAALDDGRCLSLETDHHRVELACYAPPAATTAPGVMAEVSRWQVWSALALSNAIGRLLPSGREALVLVTDRDDKNVDWGGGPPPDYTQTWLVVDLASGQTLHETSWTEAKDPPLSVQAYSSSRGVSVLIALGAPPWVGTRPAGEREALEKIILPFCWKWLESAIHAGRTRLLTTKRVIEIASGETVLQINHDQQGGRFGVYPLFHDLSPDGNYALSTVEGGHFALWNVSYQSPWQPVLPPHGGVHCAVFLPGGRAALGTAESGVIVVDCTPGIAPGDTPW